MTPSDYAAWYGAAIATVVLVWDVVKWVRSGPRIIVQAMAGSASYQIDQIIGKDITLVRIANNGDSATTLSTWRFLYRPKGFLQEKQAVAMDDTIVGHNQTPKMIAPGEVWQGVAREPPNFAHLIQSGRVFVALNFSHRSTEVHVRMRG